MARTRLDPNLMLKLANKLDFPKARINVMVSQKANKLGISSKAALAILAKEKGIGTSVYQRKLDPEIQAEIRYSLPTIITQSKPASLARKSSKAKNNQQTAVGKKTLLKAAVEYVIQDVELRSRCEDLLLGKAHFDRAINQATLILEDRIRKKAKPSKRLVGESLVGFSINADLAQTVLKLSTSKEEQRGLSIIIKGIVPAFRNTTHHHVADNFAREDALKVCGFIDVLLRIIDNSTG